jgi:3-phytase/alkaline phosphatase D
MSLFRPYFVLVMSTLLLTSCSALITPEAAQPTASSSPLVATTSIRVRKVELLGVITIPNDTVVANTPVGGLSAIAYDRASNRYTFLSDDRAIFGPVRLYQATVDVGDSTLDEGDLVWTGMIPLRDEHGERFGRGMLDPEGLVYTGDNFYVSTEGDVTVQPPIAPAIVEFTPTGEWVASLPLPGEFMPLADGSRGVRDNKGLESLTLTPDGHYLISGVENALLQDGPAATLKEESPARLLTMALISGTVISQEVYIVDAIPVAPTPTNGDADNGLADLIALNDFGADGRGTLLALERSYAEGYGNTVRLYAANTQGASDVSLIDALAAGGTAASYTPVAKERLADFGELGSALGIAPDNLEGMTLGPRLPDGRQLLLVVSDNNFNPSQQTQLWALALTDAP